MGNDLKLALLAKIKEQKHILCAQLNSQITSVQKEEAWKSICVHGKSIGVVKGSQDWKYVRDKMYGQWKMRTLKKKDNQRKTGRGGSKAMKLNAVDEIILDIIGRDSPVINGLNTPEPWGSEDLAEVELLAEEDADMEFDNFVPSSPNPHSSANPPVNTASTTSTVESTLSGPISIAVSTPTPTTRVQTTIATRGKDFLPLGKLKRKKAELQVDVLGLEKRKKLLEIYDLEERLQLPHPQHILEGLGLPPAP